MATEDDDLGSDLRRLYSGPLDRFIAEREELAKRLKSASRADAAREVRALAKPTPSAWAVNRLFVAERTTMAALLAAGERVRTGSGSAEAVRDGLGAVRAMTDELRRRGVAILAESGRKASWEVGERIATDLQALALSPEAAAEAARGWLDRDLDAPGFEALAALQLAGAPAADVAERRARDAAERRPATPNSVPAR
ncbi:MAG TPA: hypothetical protein VGE98_08405, partial [Thermoanaerobaculia bacterium]